MEFSGYLALIAAIVISRIIHERGYRLLSNEEKIRLMDGFSKSRAYSLIPLLVLIGGYYLLITKTDLDKGAVSFGYFAILIAYTLTRSVMNQRKLSALDMPTGYRRAFLISQIVSLLGVAWFFYILLSRLF